MDKMGTCLYCGKEVVITEKKRKRDFCNHKCYDNWTYHNNEKRRENVKKKAREYYERNKNNPEFKEKQRQKFQKWINKEGNREKFNVYMKENVKVWQKQRTKERQEKGVCTNCGGARDNPQFVRCEKCRIKSRKKKEILQK
jgi:hypothetical protein